MQRTQITKFLLRLALPFLPSRKLTSSPREDIPGICTLLCKRDLLLYIYSIQSLCYSTGQNFPLFVMNDGSLGSKEKKLLRRYFSITFIEQKNSLHLVKKKLKKFPFLSRFRFDPNTTLLKLKIDLFLLQPFKKCLFMDSDILFFKPPKELIRWIEKPTHQKLYIAHQEKFFKEGNFPEFSIRKAAYKLLNIQMTAGFNSGLMGFPVESKKSVIQMEKAAKLLYEIWWTRYGVQEEFLFSTLFTHSSSLKLPPDTYAVYALTEELREIEKTSKNIVMRHFSWETKDFFYKRALQLIYTTRFFGLHS